MTITKHFSKIIVLAFILSLIVLMYFGVFSSGNVKKRSPLLDKPAPEFELNRFGEGTVSLNELKGNVIVMNFWASWCIPCIKEVEILDNAYDKFSDNSVKIIGVNIWDEKEEAVAFLTKYNVDFINAYDPDGKIQVDYGVGGVPETFFIDQNGTLVEKYSGELTENILNYYINDILENQ